MEHIADPEVPDLSIGSKSWLKLAPLVPISATITDSTSCWTKRFPCASTPKHSRPATRRGNSKGVSSNYSSMRSSVSHVAE